jgi:uncharacterized membrane protein
MSRISHSIEVDVPISTAYDQWTQFEEFPRFMEGIEKVVQLDDTTLEWTAEIAGQRRTWRARITKQEPDQVIAWTSISGARNGGTVRFDRMGDRSTTVHLELDVEPEGALDKLGDWAGVVDRQVQGDLERFKEYIEGRQVETGAWRGEIDQGQRTG